jgi:hypothetical protein
LIPEFLMRFIVWLCIHSVYRIRHQDLSHIPEQGPGLLVCREAGARSVFIIAAACRRPVRFLVPERWWRIPILGFVLRAGPAIVLGAAGEGDPSPAILRALEAGDLLCWMGESEGAALRALSDRAPVIPITIRRTATQPVSCEGSGRASSFAHYWPFAWRTLRSKAIRRRAASGEVADFGFSAQLAVFRYQLSGQRSCRPVDSLSIGSTCRNSRHKVRS